MALPPSVCPTGRAGVGPGSAGRLLSEEHPGLLARALPPPAVRGPAQWALGLRFCLRPRFSTVRRAVQYRWVGGGGGWPSWALGMAARTSSQWSVVSRSEGLHCRGRPCAARRRLAPTWRRSCPCARGLRGLQARGLSLSPICPAAQTVGGRGGGGGCSGSVGLGLPCGHPGPSVGIQPSSVFAVWGLRLVLAIVWPSPWGLAVTCASVCEGAGAVAALGSSGGSASGRGQPTGPGAAKRWPQRP